MVSVFSLNSLFIFFALKFVYFPLCFFVAKNKLHISFIYHLSGDILSHLHRKQKPISCCVNFLCLRGHRFPLCSFPNCACVYVCVLVGVFTDCNYTHGCPSERTSDVSPSLRHYLSPGASVPSALHRAFPPRATRLCIAAASRATPSKLTHMSSTRRLGAEGEGRRAKGEREKIEGGGGGKGGLWKERWQRRGTAEGERGEGEIESPTVCESVKVTSE